MWNMNWSHYTLTRKLIWNRYEQFGINQELEEAKIILASSIYIDIYTIYNICLSPVTFNMYYSIMM